MRKPSRQSRSNPRSCKWPVRRGELRWCRNPQGTHRSPFKTSFPVFPCRTQRCAREWPQTADIGQQCWFCAINRASQFQRNSSTRTSSSVTDRTCPFFSSAVDSTSQFPCSAACPTHNSVVDLASDPGSENSAPDPQIEAEEMFSETPEVDQESETDSIGGESDIESLAGSEHFEEVHADRPPDFVVHQPQITAAFRDLDEVNLVTLFDCRAQVMQTVPFFLRGGFKRAVRCALEEVIRGCVHHDIPTQERGWKLFFLLPRMFLSRPGRGNKDWSRRKSWRIGLRCSSPVSG